jgi:AcrR family transcriptional regulator
MQHTDPTPARRTVAPRTGRRPAAANADTRTAILGAARQLFAERGYENASMRAIGAAAGVDAALINHFFGSKANLLAESIEWPFDPEAELPGLLSGGPAEVGERLVTLFVRTWDREGPGNPMIMLMRAASTEPAAAKLLADFMRSRLFGPLLAELGSDQGALRGNLAGTQLGGLGLGRYIFRFEPLASANSADVIRWVSPSVQRYLTDPL